MSVSYTHQIGFVLLPALLAMIIAFKDSMFSSRALFPVATILAFVPVFGSSLYVSMLIVPFVCALGSSFFGSVYRRVRRRRIVVFVLLLTIVGSLILPVWSLARWNSYEYSTGDTALVGNQVYNDANYLCLVAEGRYSIGNGVVLSQQLQSLSGALFLSSGVSAIVNGDVSAADIRNNLTRSEASFPGNLYLWFQYRGDNFVNVFVEVMAVWGAAYVTDTYARNPLLVDFAAGHSKLFFVLDNNWPTKYVGAYGVVNSPLLSEIRTGVTSDSLHLEMPSYIVYQSQRSTIFIFHLPV
jgi:hypothetical protein